MLTLVLAVFGGILLITLLLTRWDNDSLRRALEREEGLNAEFRRDLMDQQNDANVLGQFSSSTDDGDVDIPPAASRSPKSARALADLFHSDSRVGTLRASGGRGIRA